MDKGKILEEGSPGDLLRRRGRFHAMAADAGINTTAETDLDSSSKSY